MYLVNAILKGSKIVDQSNMACTKGKTVLAQSQMVTRSKSPTTTTVMGNNVSTNNVPPSPKIMPPLSREEILSPSKNPTNEQTSGNENEKLNSIMEGISGMRTSCLEKVNTIELALLHRDEGVFPRLKELEKISDEQNEKMIQLEEQNGQLSEDVRMLKGIIQVQDRRMQAMSTSVTNLRARSMSKNTVISGITGDESNKSCLQKVQNFAKSTLRMQEEDIKIKKHTELERRYLENDQGR